jgi:hypothetical protein
MKASWPNSSVQRLLGKECGKRLNFIVGQALCHNHVWVLALPIAGQPQLSGKL